MPGLDDTNKDGQRDVKIDDKIRGQPGDRGWTEGEVRDLANTSPTGTTTDSRRPNKTPDGNGRNDPASVYGSPNGGHIVVNDVTGEVTQVSDKKPVWVPDSRIKWK
ncbi:colicin E5-related ribonuclease [Duganella vulcania]|uniref:colicin E5-related ribonuclease n=1 Tax=Duganella vulcania TaxID=2692166 RepID=UPI001C2D264A